jgi:hypothetical protein
MAVSGDTPAGGAEARAVESGMDGWLGRVKERAPGGEVPSGKYRKSFDDDHGSETFWAAETSGLGWGGSDGSGWVRRGMVGEQSLTKGQECCAPAIGQEAERADADKAAGQDVEQEAAQELLRTERHHSLLITVGIILPTESNLVMLESHEAVVGDGHAMGVAGEIAEHMMGTAEGWLGIDDPVLTEEGTQEGAERFLVFQGLERSSEPELALLESSL